MVASSERSHGARTLEKRFGVVPSEFGFASLNTDVLNKRLQTHAWLMGSKVSGLKMLLNSPLGGTKSAQTPGPFQKAGCTREFGCPSGVPLRWRMEADTFQPPTKAFKKPPELPRSRRPLPKGRSQVNADLNTWVRSSPA